MVTTLQFVYSFKGGGFGSGSGSGIGSSSYGMGSGMGSGSMEPSFRQPEPSYKSRSAL